MSDGRVRLRELGILAAIAITSFAVRWPFRNAVLMRDEADYLLAGKRILAGDLPYLDLYLQTTPLTFYWSAAVQHVFGSDLAAIRVAAFVFGLVTTVVVYATARRLGGPVAAAFAAAAFSAMTFDQSGAVYRTSVEAFLLLWIALAVALWRDGAPRRWPRALLAGVAAGLAYQTEQAGLVVLVFLVVERGWYWLREERFLGRGPAQAFRDAGLASAGFAAVFALTAAAFAAGGALPEYLECTVFDNFEYAGNRWGGVKRAALLAVGVLRNVALVDLGFWIFGAGALLARGFRRPLLPGNGLCLLLFGLAGAAFAAGFPGRHYYEPLIVPLAIGSGLACAWLAHAAATDRRLAIRLAAAFSLGAVWLAPISRHVEDWRHPEPRSTIAWFDASEVIADYVAQRSGPEECFLIVGSESQVYFLADRPPCTRLVLSYPLTGDTSYAAALRREFRADLASRRPRYVLLFADERSLGQPDSRLLLEGVLADLERDYTVEDTLPGRGLGGRGESDYVWVYRHR